MRSRALPIVASFLLVAAAATAAPTKSTTHYRWKDSAGVVHFGDTIPPSALAGGYDIVDSKGTVVKHVQRELTPAERKAAAEAARREAAQRRAARQRGIEDAQLLAAYPTAEDLQSYQQIQLKQMQAEITTLETNLRSQEATLTELLGHAADFEHDNQPVPPYLPKRIADQRKTVNEERNALAVKRTELAAARSRFAAQLEHYRSLQGQVGGSASTDP